MSQGHQGQQDASRHRAVANNPFLLVLPSGKLTWRTGKSPFFRCKSSILQANFRSYVKLPKGIPLNQWWAGGLGWYNARILWSGISPWGIQNSTPHQISRPDNHWLDLPPKELINRWSCFSLYWEGVPRHYLGVPAINQKPITTCCVQQTFRFMFNIYHLFIYCQQLDFERLSSYKIV